MREEREDMRTKLRIMAVLSTPNGRTRGGRLKYRHVKVGLPAQLNEHKLPKLNEKLFIGSERFSVVRMWSVAG